MRLRSIVGLCVLTFVVFTTIEGDGRAQFGGFDLKNPDNMFAQYARAQGAKDELEIGKVQSRLDPELANKMKAYAARRGIANGKLTRAQFADFWTKEALPQMEERMKQRGFGGFGKGPATPAAPATPATTPGGEKTAASTADMDKDKKTPQPTGFQPRPFNEEEAKNYFKRMDDNNSNALDSDEYRRSDIRREVEKWDTNKNKLVEETEWLAYMKSRHDEREQERRVREEERRLFEEFKALRKARELIIPIGPLMPDRPVVIRADNLPEELPTWFKELDTDEDAQVGLYEWRAAEKDDAEFRDHDRNGDGLLTPNEVLWYTENADRLADLPPTGPTAPPISTEKMGKTFPAAPEKGKGGWGGFGGRGKGGTPKRP